MNSTMTLGNDSWANECRMKIREGLRSRNMVEVGLVRFWRIYETVRITDLDNCNEVVICCQNEAEAVTRITDITSQMLYGKTLDIILGRDDLPVELL